MGWADRPGQRVAGWVSAHFRQKWTRGAGRRQTPKISRPAGQDFGSSRHGWGGGGGGRPGKILVGEGVKSEDSLWRRDLSALGPFGAEANWPFESPIQYYCSGNSPVWVCLQVGRAIVS